MHHLRVPMPAMHLSVYMYTYVHICIYAPPSTWPFPSPFYFCIFSLNLLLLARLFQQYHPNEILDKQKQTNVAKSFIHF